jgi:hypothetical protein
MGCRSRDHEEALRLASRGCLVAGLRTGISSFEKRSPASHLEGILSGHHKASRESWEGDIQASSL